MFSFRLSKWFMLVAFSLSIGMGLISGGLGGVVPGVRNVAAPLVCRGEIERQSEAFSYKPGQSGISTTTYCVDDDGDRRDITFSLIGAAGAFYSVIVFVATYAVGRTLFRKLTSAATPRV